MGLTLPNLDDRTYADLLDEARALIPAYTPGWTDHNPADPGITLVELFAWLTEMLIYRVNRVTDDTRRTFLKLLNPDWPADADLEEGLRTAVLGLRERYRAVTCEDYEELTREASPDVARVRCVPQRDLDADTEAERALPRPGHVSVIIVPRATGPAPQPAVEVRQAVWGYLDPRRLLTIRHHVVGPVYAPVTPTALVARRADVPEPVSAAYLSAHWDAVPATDLRKRIVVALAGFLDPLSGGVDGTGWPFGRDVYVSELYQLLEGVPGVDHVPDVATASQCPPELPRCAVAPELWHDSGDLIGLGLAEHHLPLARVDPGRIFFSAAFVPLQALVRLRIPDPPAAAATRRAVKSAVRDFFYPLPGRPSERYARAGWEVNSDGLRAAVQARLPGGGFVERVELRADPARLRRDEARDLTRVVFAAGELADARVELDLRVATG